MSTDLKQTTWRRTIRYGFITVVLVMMPFPAAAGRTVEACATVNVERGQAQTCPASMDYCEKVAKTAWERSNHRTCTAIKRRALKRYRNQNKGCEAKATRPCYEK